MDKFTINPMNEIFLPAINLEESKSFYNKLGYTVSKELEWGFIQLTREDSLDINLIDAKMWKKVTMGFTSDDLDELARQLSDNEIEIAEDSRHLEPKRLGVYDPSGNELTIHDYS